MASLVLDMERGPGTDDLVPNPRKEHMKIEVTFSDESVVTYEGSQLINDDDQFVSISAEDGAFVRLNWRYIVGYVESIEVDQPVDLDA